MSVEPLYDWDVFERRIEPGPVSGPRGRGGVAAAVLAAALWAVDDVVMSDKPRTPVIEEMDVPGVEPGERVVVHLVRGAPSRSWATVSP